MNKKNAALFLALFLLDSTAWAFEVGEFKSGMTRDQLKSALKSWNFKNNLETSDTLVAYDSADNPANRRYVFMFCNDKLVGFDQDIVGSFRNFITVTGNYNIQYGDPMKLLALNNVLGAGEKNTLAIFWRKMNDIVGVRYLLQPNSEQLSITNQVSNNCWRAPR